LESNHKSFVLRPAEPADVEWLAAEEAKAYAARDAIPGARLQAWFAANRYVFGIIVSRDGRRVGHLNILPLKPEPLRHLIAGTWRERDVPGEGLYAVAEREQVTALWVESVMVNLASSFLRARALLQGLDDVPALIGRLADPAKVQRIYALAATEAGDQLVRRFGFEVVVKRDQRADEHDLFAASFAALQARASNLRIL
jgi:hypothetical protein